MISRCFSLYLYIFLSLLESLFFGLFLLSQGLLFFLLLLQHLFMKPLLLDLVQLRAPEPLLALGPGALLHLLDALLFFLDDGLQLLAVVREPLYLCFPLLAVSSLLEDLLFLLMDLLEQSLPLLQCLLKLLAEVLLLARELLLQRAHLLQVVSPFLVKDLLLALVLLSAHILELLRFVLLISLELCELVLSPLLLVLFLPLEVIDCI